MNRRGAGAWAALLALAASLSGCKFQMTRIDLNRPLTPEAYEQIDLGSDVRRDVLAVLGPPDAVLYTTTEVVFDYRAESHRATTLRFFLPSDIVPFIDPFAWLGVHRYFFDPFEEPQAFRPTLADRLSRYTLDTVISYIPYTRGQDIVILRSRQWRGDVLRVILDREDHLTLRKGLLLSTGEYVQETWVKRAFLGAD